MGFRTYTTLYHHQLFLFILFWFFFLFVLLAYERYSECVFDTLGLGMGFLEFLRGAFEVGTEVFELGGDTLLQGELLHVDRMVGVGGDSGVGVLLPRERLGPADDDLDTVVLDGAGEVGRLALLLDERLHSGFHLRTETLQRCFGFVTCYLRSEKLIDYFIIGCHNVKSFVRGLYASGHSMHVRTHKPFAG